jgi:hypothetical protein
LAKLKAGSSTDIGVTEIWKSLQTEEISEELEVGIDSEEGFAHMNKERDLGDSIGIQVDKFDVVEVEKLTEKF